VEALEDRVVPSTNPLALDDWADTDGTTPVAINVLANDIPSPGGHLVPGSITIVSAPTHGSLKSNSDAGEITYTANGNFAGTDFLQYTVRDDLGGTSNVATVSVRVNRPVAADDWIDTDGTTPVNVAVLANDTDPDGNSHIDPTQGTGAFVTLVSNPSHGSAVLNADGSFTYTAQPNFTGTDSFQYTVTDDNGGVSLPATAYVRVNVPTAANDLASFSGTTPVNVNVLDNDTDPDGNQHLVPSSVTVTTNPVHGTATAHPDGTITYQANTGFTGTDTFQYTVSDDNGATSAPGTVTVAGFAPGAVNDDFTDTDGTTQVTLNVLANDSAHPGATLVPGSLTLVGNAQHGNATLGPNAGEVSYIAGASFSGTDTFQYTVRDNLGAVYGPATVSVRVNRPVAADDWIDTDGANPVVINELANDADPDGNSHIDPTQHTGAFVTQVSDPAHGSVALNADGTFTYTAQFGFTGTDSFQYMVTDDNGGVSMPATVFVRVNVPTAADDFAAASTDLPVTIDVLANDTDPDGNDQLDPASVALVTAPSHGTATPNPDGSFTYTASPGWVGTDTFQYTVDDLPGARSNIATVVVITSPPVSGDVAVTGTDGNDTLVVDASGLNSGTYALNGGQPVAFAGLTTLTFLGGGGNDTLVIHNGPSGRFAPTAGIRFDGGGQAVDTVVIDGGGAGFREDYEVNPDAGTATLFAGNGTVNQVLILTDVAVVSDTSRAGVLTVHDATDAGGMVTLADGTQPGVGQVQFGATSALQFAGKSVLVLDTGLTTADEGHTINLANHQAVTLLGTVIVNGGPGDDLVFVRSTAAGTLTQLNTGGGNDTVVLSSAAGMLDQLAGALAVDAGPGANQLYVSESGQTAADTVTLADGWLASSAAPSLVHYTATGGTFSRGVVFVSGSGNNTVSVPSLTALGPTLAFGGAGNDTFLVTLPAPAGPAAIPPGTLTIDGGGGSNQLSLTESTTAADTLYLTGNAVVSTASGFALSYAATGGSFGRGVLLSTGSGNDTVLVLGTAAGADTHVYTQGGNDQVTVRTTPAAGGRLTVSGGGQAGDLLSVVDPTGKAAIQTLLARPDAGLIDVLYGNHSETDVAFDGFAQVLTSPLSK
jgi:hypothetical protein